MLNEHENQKHNADHGSSPKKDLTCLPPSQMETTITKSKLKSSEASPLFVGNNNKYKITNPDNDVDFNNSTIEDETINETNESNIPLKSLLAVIDNYDEEILCFGKSSLYFSETVYESVNQ